MNIDFSVFWVIKDAGKFLFKIQDPQGTVKAAFLEDITSSGTNNTFSPTIMTSIRGIVLDKNGDPLSGVNVLIAQLNTGTQSNEQGDFSIENLSAGNYTLTISYLGFKTQSKQVSVQNDGVLTLGNIVLYEGNEILNEVVINGERQNKFSRKKTAYVAKLPLKDIENTQVYSTVTNELLESQVVTNFEDALKIIKVRASTMEVSGYKNWSIVQDDLVTYRSPGSDLVYSVGVLHHLADPHKGFQAVIQNTKRGGQFHCWVYAEEGNKFVIRFVDPVRKITSKLPWRITKYLIATPLAGILYLFVKYYLL